MATTHSHYVPVGDGIDLYVEETGEGRPLVFIPGWTMTTEVFAKQVAHFSKAYRFVRFTQRSSNGMSGIATSIL